MNIVPCETCGVPTPYLGTKRCDRCWAAERRLPDYLKSPGGQKFVREHLPILDDSQGYDQILTDNEVTISYDDQTPDNEGYMRQLPPDACGWSFSWKHGAIFIGQTNNLVALKAAALFVSLWLRGVSASLCRILMNGYIDHLERQP